ncbi:ArnT family glycosyltransferase [Hymenobacter cavernae]|uniref:Glycosyltransferase RgtA/B/C/D-like domain-containing protein n=1 Tax=Hymenobacter cavernae TaxID=2044852 RepID=A0ABQ1TTB6_9BACT|nr:glycosyltransferase family 39 protein [Hymenobacter cavernae]GGF00551.1 hypothetical protein GCM10011383_09200 [Hymenobacter cavernae]
MLRSISPLWQQVIPWLLVTVLAYPILFQLINELPIQQWDEARTALNAVGIWQHHDWIVLRHLNRPDLWNCKPPLWPWLLAISIKLFGPSEFSIRLPTALAAFATTLIVFKAGWHWLGSWRAGLLASLVLLTAQGYVMLHVALTSDFDTLLTLWTTLGALSWLGYLVTGRSRLVWLTGLSFLLAVLTKGVAGLLFGPGLLLATIVIGQARRLFQPAVYGALAGVLVGGALWYVVRESMAPGYLAAVWEYELGGPALHMLEGHTTSFSTYWLLMIEEKFTPWIMPMLLGGALSYFLPRGSRSWQLSCYCLCVSFTFLLTISLIQTRLPWYAAPMYPLLALQTAAGLVWVGRMLEAQLAYKLRSWSQLLVVLVVATPAYWLQLRYVEQVYNARSRDASTLYGRHLQAQIRDWPGIQEYIIGVDGKFNDVVELYRQIAKWRYQHHTTIITPWDASKTSPGQIVVACGVDARRPWLRQFRTTVLVRSDSCVTLKLEGWR